MRILVAPDSYKGSLSASQVADCMEEGIREAFQDAEIVKIPIADGGEGTVEAIIGAAGGRYMTLQVSDPLGEPVSAVYGILRDESPVRTAVIEMAAASGLTLVPAGQLNPLLATSYGTGELILGALDQGCRKIIIGLGGSATNDGGVGMAQALGVRFLDDNGKEIGPGGGQLARIRHVDFGGLDKRIAESKFIIASDVKNPLCGSSGASAVFGPQKGATPEMVAALDTGLSHLSRLVQEQLGLDRAEAEGSGAAGGMGFGAMVFLNGTMRRGIDIVLELTKFEERVRDCDLVLTGEGRTDTQTAFGKTPAGVAEAAKMHQKPVICISGGVAADLGCLHDIGLDAIIGACGRPMTLDEAIDDAAQLVRNAVAQTLRVLQIPGKYGFK